MKNFNYVDGGWRRPRLTVADIPEEFVRWWRTVPKDHRHLYMYGGLYSMVVAFKEGQQIEAERLRQQIERLSDALNLVLPYVEDAQDDTTSDVDSIEAAVQQICSALRKDLDLR